LHVSTVNYLLLLILHTTGVSANTKLNDTSIYDCYYCTSFKTDIKKDYEKHVVFTHPERPCYPSKADLEKLRLKAQAKDWEI
jgi:proteasome lid subunit RPN8/RPN11